MRGHPVFKPGRVAQCLTPERLRESSRVPEGADALQERPIQPLSNAIQLRHVMGGEPPCCARCRKVLVKGLAKVLAPAVRTQYLDATAVLLCDRPCLKEFVLLEDFIFSPEQIDDCEVSRVICEGDEVSCTLQG
jgi:hypothetical protein